MSLSKPAKQDLIQQLLTQLQSELTVLERAVQNAAEGATHPDAKPENKYDTRGLESSYLAGAQQERVQELRGSILLLQSLELRSFQEDLPIGASALIQVLHGEQEKYYFLLQVGAGYTLQGHDGPVFTLTPQSPLGKALMGKRRGDTFTLKMAQATKDCEILDLW